MVFAVNFIQTRTFYQLSFEMSRVTDPYGRASMAISTAGTENQEF